MAQACLDESLKHARSRRQFGQPIFNFQAVQFKISDMAVSIELARNLYLKAAWLKDQGRKHTFEASAAKLYASEMAEKVASDAVQIHGGYGFMEEYPVSRYFKSVKAAQIIEGTSEVQVLLQNRCPFVLRFHRPLYHANETSRFYRRPDNYWLCLAVLEQMRGMGWIVSGY